MHYTIQQIQEITSGQFLVQSSNGTEIEHLLIDSRKLLLPSTSLFFALNGPRRKGIDYLPELYKSGVRNFIVDEKVETTVFPSANIILVNNVVDALQKLAQYHRSRFSIPVIGITGSNGKTIVKEWLYQLLQLDCAIIRSPKSYNSQIGVPLSVWEMSEMHQLAIFEAGISRNGEMSHLQSIIQPTIGILTNIGDAHSEGFSSTKEKILQKCQLFNGVKLLIYQKEIFGANEISEPELKSVLGNSIHYSSWSKVSKEATLYVHSILKNSGITQLQGIYKTNTQEISIPFVDEASIDNAITCWLYLLEAGYSSKVIQERMQLLKSVEMRLQLNQGINNCTIINDSYSADINSLAIALDFLQQQKQHKKKTLILSDILQSGKESNTLYEDIAEVVEQNNIQRLIGVGSEISLYKNKFAKISETHFFSSTQDLISNFSSLHFNNETILLKGARVYEFEQIAKLLELKSHQTILEINLNALAHNLKAYQSHLSPGTKIMAMVKAFSYGSGSFEVANLLQYQKVDYLAVAYTDEGVELRKAGITLPIMVMNAEENTFELLLKYSLEPEIFSFSILQAFLNFLLDKNVQHFPIHLKLDTGMRRLGFEESEIEKLGDALAKNEQVKVQSVFSHLAASDNVVHDDFTNYQSQQFLQYCAHIEKSLGYSFIKHIANTSAIHRHKNIQLDMVRLGIGLYGVDASNTMQQQLKNVTTLKTTIAQIKTVKQGDSIGYNRSGIAEKDSTIATVRIGYADGYPRRLSNGVGKMFLNNQFVPVIGNVCMDMIMLDITGVSAKEGDEVIVFGEDLPVTTLASWAETIPYEILTGVSQRVKRVYYEE